jgi:hypothetical protein
MSTAIKTCSINSKNQLVINKNVTVDGTWSLTTDHELCLTLDATQDTQFGDKIILSGRFNDVSPNILSFEASHHENHSKITSDIIALQGVWEADDNNKLIFKVKKESGRHDVLTFTNTWIMDDKNRIIYEYETASLVFKKKETHQLTFKGTWDIIKNNRLYYELSNLSGSGFDFRVGTSVLEKNQIKTKIMIGSQNKDISISGQWKVSDEVGLTFDVTYDNGAVKGIVFGSEFQMSDKDKLSLKIGNGFEARLTQELIKDVAEFSTAIQTSGSESRATWGVNLKF